jgi:AcrR family transcriptional regulator
MRTNSHKARSENSVRCMIRDAALCLAASGRVIPTLDSLVQETGLSAAQIEAHFPSMDDLAIEIRKVAEDLFGDLEDAMPAKGALVPMLEELVKLRARYYEAAADFKHLGDAGGRFLPSVATSHAIRAARYRARLTEILEPHCLGKTADVVAQVELMTSWDSWRHLRGVQRLSAVQAVDLLKSVLTAVASQVNQHALAE